MSDQNPNTHPPDTVRLTDKTLTHLETLMAASVRGAIHESLTEETAERFWGAGLRVLQRQATDHAGRFVIGGLWLRYYRSTDGNWRFVLRNDSGIVRTGAWLIQFALIRTSTS